MLLLLQGFVRPGCLHLTVDVVLPHRDAEPSLAGGARGVAERLLSGWNGAFWAEQASQVGSACLQTCFLRHSACLCSDSNMTAHAMLT